MEIREWRTVADARGVDRVNRRAWREAYAEIFPADLLDRDAASDEDLRERFAAVTSWTGVPLVAERTVDGDERVVGYAVARWGADTKPFVADGDAGLKEIYVDPAHWGDGVGTALLERVEREVPDRYEGLTLSMLAGNERGRAFYESRGFREVGDWHDEIAGETYDCVLFRKSL